MSIQAVNWVLEHSTTRLGERLVLLAIANHAGTRLPDGTFEAWPGVATIARESRLAERVVQDIIGRLADTGHLECRINGAPDQRVRRDRRPNLYRIHTVHGVQPPRIPSELPRGETPPHPVTPGNGVKAPDTPSTSRGEGSPRDGVKAPDATGCRKPSPEPSVEPSENQPPLREPRGLPPDGDPDPGGERSDSDPPQALTADERRARIHQAVTILAERAADRARDVGHRPSYVASIAERLAGEHATAAHRLLAEHPDLPPVALADLLEPPPAARALTPEIVPPPTGPQPPPVDEVLDPYRNVDVETDGKGIAAAKAALKSRPGAEP